MRGAGKYGRIWGAAGMKAWVGMNLQGYRHRYVGSEEPLPFLEIGLALMVHDTPRYGVHVAVKKTSFSTRGQSQRPRNNRQAATASTSPLSDGASCSSPHRCLDDLQSTLTLTEEAVPLRINIEI